MSPAPTEIPETWVDLSPGVSQLKGAFELRSRARLPAVEVHARHAENLSLILMLFCCSWTGYGARDEAHGKKLDLEVIEYKPQAWTEEMVDIKVSVCGVCGSDCHTLTNGWPSPTSYPAVVGHEIVGTVVRAGKESGHQIGARVGVGAQAGSCGKCDLCLRSREQYCSEGMRGTYQVRWPLLDLFLTSADLSLRYRASGPTVRSVREATPLSSAALVDLLSLCPTISPTRSLRPSSALVSLPFCFRRAGRLKKRAPSCCLRRSSFACACSF